MRRLRRLQNVPDSIGYSLRMSRVPLAPFNLKIGIIQQRKKPLKNYSGSTSLVQKLSWNLLEAGMVLNWSFRNGKDPGGTGRCPEGSTVTIN